MVDRHLLSHRASPGTVGPAGPVGPVGLVVRGAAVLAFLAVAVVWRLVRADVGAPPNLELVTAASFATALLVRSPWAGFAPLAVAVTSDLVLGNDAVLWFVWSAWAVVGIGTVLASRWERRRPPAGGLAARPAVRRLVAALGVAVGASVWFFVWTNLGVWLLGDGVWYPRTGAGLVSCYVAGLPFFRTMLLGNLVLVPAAAAVVTLVEGAAARVADRRSSTVVRAGSIPG